MSCVRYFQPRLKARLLAGDEPGWLANHPRRSYVRQAVLSFPPWADRKELNRLRREAASLTAMYGEPYTLDHVVPLNHPRVCGLSVPWNLKVVPRYVNQQKGNAWCQWHGELFDQPEQLRIFL